MDYDKARKAVIRGMCGPGPRARANRWAKREAYIKAKVEACETPEQAAAIDFGTGDYTALSFIKAKWALNDAQIYKLYYPDGGHVTPPQQT